MCFVVVVLCASVALVAYATQHGCSPSTLLQCPPRDDDATTTTTTIVPTTTTTTTAATCAVRCPCAPCATCAPTPLPTPDDCPPSTTTCTPCAPCHCPTCPSTDTTTATATATATTTTTPLPATDAPTSSNELSAAIAMLRALHPKSVGGDDAYWPLSTWPRLDRYVEGAMGEVGGVAVDRRRNEVYVFRRVDNHFFSQNSIADDPVVVFDAHTGDFVRGFGDKKFVSPHGCFFDPVDDTLWLTDTHLHIAVQYTRTGERKTQIGVEGQKGTNSDKHRLNEPADVLVHPTTRDVYVADGYGNRRVAVFTHTGDYVRQIEAHGQEPWSIVHSLALSANNELYVVDRQRRRIQLFDLSHTPPMFVDEHTTTSVRGPDARSFESGSALGAVNWWHPFALALDNEHGVAYVVHTTPNPQSTSRPPPRVSVFSPSNATLLHWFGGADVLCWPHDIDFDEQRSLFTGEVYNGRVARKWVPNVLPPSLRALLPAHSSAGNTR